MQGLKSLGAFFLGFLFNLNAFATTWAAVESVETFFSHAQSSDKPQLALVASELAVGEDHEGHQDSSCKVQARFLKEQHQFHESQVKVWWNFEIQKRYSPQNICPSQTFFALTIRVADVAHHDDKSLQYVYPVHILPPRPNQVVRLHVRFIKERNEWLVTNWKSGYQP